jgi:hypothetical protein
MPVPHLRLKVLAGVPAEVLGLSWWLLWPAFSVLSLRLGVERACRDPYDLLPVITSDPRWAWPLALVYVLAHIWFVAVYVITVANAQSLAPAMRSWQTCWGRDAIKIALMAVALMIEYAPVPLWKFLGSVLFCA